MNYNKKEEIKKLRKNGLGYKRISVITGLSLNTVKSYCRRWDIEKETNENVNRCLLCIKQKVR